MHLDCLPESTRAALERVQALPAISKYILIDRTALALQAGHRISEDLDFVSLNGKLDRAEIRSIVQALSDGGDATLVTPAAAREDMENAGLDIDDSHQAWLVSGVKISFFAPDSPDQMAVYSETPTHRLDNVNVLDENGIFRLKGMVLMDRRTSRDLFDLWFFISERDRSIGDILDAMDSRKHDRPPADDRRDRCLLETRASQRLCQLPRKPRKNSSREWRKASRHTGGWWQQRRSGHSRRAQMTYFQLADPHRGWIGAADWSAASSPHSPNCPNLRERGQ